MIKSPAFKNNHRHYQKMANTKVNFYVSFIELLSEAGRLLKMIAL